MPRTSIFSLMNKSAVGRKMAYLHRPQSSKTNTDHGVEETTVNDEESGFNTITSHFFIIARRLETIMTGGAWTIASVVATIISLFAYDFTISFLSKDVDMSTDIILLIVFVFFFVELIVASLVRRGYFLSFWFWLDFIAMVSMIPDLALFLQLFGAGTGDLNFSNTQASKAGKSGRSTAALKGIRMIRFSRLLRVLRAFKFFQAEDELDEDVSDPVDVSSSKVGQTVSEAVTKKVIVLVLFLVLALPWMDPSGASYAEAATTAAMLFKQCLENGIDQEVALSAFEKVGIPALRIDIAGFHFTDSPTFDERRVVELWTLDIGNDDSITFDIRDNVLEEALLGMCLTIFAIFVFASSALFVTASTMKLVVAPIARLTELLTKMAGVIGLLGGAQTVENLMENHDEMFIVEALCERIMDIFGTGGHPVSSGKSSPGKKSGKALSMMASRKITQITSGDRIWEIDVKEKHRTSVIERRVHQSFRDFVNSEAVMFDIHEKQADKLPVLDSLKSIVENPITLYCLRMFMTSNLTINNLLFVLEAEEWKNERKAKFDVLYEKYFCEDSPMQINLDASMFTKLEAIKYGTAPLRETCLEDPVAETWELLENNVYRQFLDSNHCKFYLHMKDVDPRTLNQLQMSIPEGTEDKADCQTQIIRNSETTESSDVMHRIISVED